MKHPLVNYTGSLFFCIVAFSLVLPPPAHALRPFLSTTDAAVVGFGTIELEVGFDGAHNIQGDVDENVYALPNAVINIGIAKQLDLVISTALELVDDEIKNHTLASISNTGIALKALWWQETSGLSSFATEFGLTIPTARREFQTAEKRRIEFGGIAIYTGRAERFSYHLNLGGAMEASPEDGEYIGTFSWAGASKLAITERTNLVAELSGKLSPGTDDDLDGLVGITYTTQSGIKFDAASFTSLEHNLKNWGITVGITYAFPAF